MYLGVTLLLVGAGAHHDLELGLVEGHQPEVEAGEEAGQAEQHRQQHHAGPGWQQRPPGQVLLDTHNHFHFGQWRIFSEDCNYLV